MNQTTVSPPVSSLDSYPKHCLGISAITIVSALVNYVSFMYFFTVLDWEIFKAFTFSFVAHSAIFLILNIFFLKTFRDYILTQPMRVAALLLFVFAFGVGVIALFYGAFQGQSEVCAALLMSLSSFLILSTVVFWAFVDLPIDEVIYENLDGTFFDDMVTQSKVGGFRAWFHLSRFKKTQELVNQYYVPGAKIVDFACGSCTWNTESLPVTGLDVNKDLLEYGLKKGRLIDIQPGDMYSTPFESNSVDIVISSHVFEHLDDPKKALKEIFRVLKPGGVFIIDVPYDFFMSPFYLLFNVHCFLTGFLTDDDLYKKRCGHINHFSKKRLLQLIKTQNFNVDKVTYSNYLTILAASIKNES